jgi:hypothetical protein
MHGFGDHAIDISLSCSQRIKYIWPSFLYPWKPELFFPFEYICLDTRIRVGSIFTSLALPYFAACQKYRSALPCFILVSICLYDSADEIVYPSHFTLTILVKMDPTLILVSRQMYSKGNERQLSVMKNYWFHANYNINMNNIRTNSLDAQVRIKSTVIL